MLISASQLERDRLELIRRLEVRKSLTKWCQLLGHEPALHHQLLISLLESVTHSPTSRYVIVTMPPGSAKSTYISVCFPPWFLAQRPSATILATSYSATIIEMFGRKCRNLIDEHTNVLGYALAADSKAAGEWETSKSGRYFTAGTTSGIAGHRADLAFIDDPIGTEAEAMSQTFRDKLWDWYINDFWPRLKPNGSVIIVANRRHEDDLVGRLLLREGRKRDGGLWEELSFPYFAEEGDVLGRIPSGLSPSSRLWPEWYTVDHAKKVAQLAEQNPLTFAGLWQQRPTSEKGNFFQREWLLPYRQAELPSELSYYCTSDHAVSRAQTADRTCLLPFGVDDKGTLWVLPDMVWDRLDAKATIDAMLRLMAKYRPIYWWAGKDHIQASLGPFLREAMLKRGVATAVVAIPPGRADKRQRAQAVHGLMACGRVRFPTFASWWPLAEAELMSFDSGEHDDFVDALAIMGQCVTAAPGAPQAAIVPSGGLPTITWPPTVDWCKRNNQSQTSTIVHCDA